MGKFGGRFFSSSSSKGDRLVSTCMAVAVLFAASIVAELMQPSLQNPELACATFQPKAPEPLPATPPPPPTTEVIVPVRDIDSGTALSADMFTTKTVLAELVPAEMVTSVSAVEEQYNQRRLTKGALVLKRDLRVAASDASFDIPPGSRAVTISVNSTSSIEGHARPGSTVDLSFIYTNPNGDKVVTTLVRNARVASVNGTTQSDDLIPAKGSYPLTLITSERDAKAIQLAATIGTISLSLLDRPETMVSDPTAETFTVSSLTDPAPPLEASEKLTAVPRIVRTGSTENKDRRIMTTNRQMAEAK